MKLIKILFYLLLTVNCITAHGQQPTKWKIGNWAEINFNGQVAIPSITTDTLRTNQVNAPYFDDNGNLKFFSNGIAVTNQNLDTIQNGALYYNSTYTNASTGSNVINGTIILPRPGYTDQNYIFHSSFQSPIFPSIETPGDLYYSIIDQAANSGNGAIGATKNFLLKDSLWYGNINAIRHGNGRDWWLVSGKHMSDTIYTWLVLQDTILGPFGQKKGIAYPGELGIWQTTFDSDGGKFAIAYNYQPSNAKRILVSEFNRCTGDIYNVQMLTMSDTGNWEAGVCGVEFSPSGRYIYASTGNSVFQFDLMAGNVQTSKIRVGIHDLFPNPFQSGFGNMKLAPDGKIYIQTCSGNYSLDVINYPDSAGVACNIQLRQIDFNALFSTYMSIQCVPHYPDYYLGALTGSICDTLLSVPKNLEEQSFAIIPNPNRGEFKVTQTFPYETTIKIFEINGRLIYNKKFPPYVQIYVELDEPESGIYMLTVQNENQINSIKVIIN